ncbi:MAG: L-serine ammonia-lyase [Bifidobacterium sp.]|nr:L-serine ammonia-lyase [Bifidobacterium sp.]
MFSILDMFKIGVGPSSSHTVGPMIAASNFVESLEKRDLLGRVSRVKSILYGSLSMTGLGHGTDRATMAGLEGNVPATVDTDHLLEIRTECESTGKLKLGGRHTIPFDYSKDVIFEKWKMLAAHPNGMRFEAFDDKGQKIDEQVWYSIGGGFVRQGHADDLLIGIHEKAPKGTTFAEEASADSSNDFPPEAPYPFASGNELLEICKREGKSISEIVWANETASRSPQEVKEALLNVWRHMDDCVKNGCMSTQRTLPGGLDVPRRAPKIYHELSGNADILSHNVRRPSALLEASECSWVDLFALAVNEENAGGGRIVTAPTNGSAGVIPAVLEYYWHFAGSADEEGIIRFLLAAGAVGYLFKRNASISGAEVGCQGEVGSAASMAAAGLCEVMGGTVQEVENAAEVAMEHHLGLTCDPVAGLVQIPCIERNAMAANTAINAVRMALLGNGQHMVSLDQVIKTMKDTGADMMSKYKETSEGGLAVNMVEC